MKWAWIENDRIRDICHADPAECYHPDVAKFYDTGVSDDAVNGDGWINGALVKPEPAPAPEPAPRQWAAADFRAGLTLTEKVKWDNDSAPEIVTVKAELAAPKSQAEVTELLQLLVEAGVIAQASMDKVLA